MSTIRDRAPSIQMRHLLEGELDSADAFSRTELPSLLQRLNSWPNTILDSSIMLTEVYLMRTYIANGSLQQ